MRRASSAITIALGLSLLALISAGCRVTLPTAGSSPRSAAGARTAAEAPVDAAVVAAAAAAAKDAALAKLLEPGPWKVETFLTTMLLPDVPSRDGRGEVDTLINRFRIRFGKQLGMGGFLTLESAYENRVYTFGGLEGALPGTGVPSAAFHGVGLRVRYLQAVNERWAGFLFGRVRCEWEAGVSPIDGLSWAVSPGVGYRFDNGMNLGVGVAIIDRIESDLLIIPGPQFTWKIDDRWSTSLVGTEFLVECRVAPQWKASFAAWFDSPRTRLHRLEPGNAGVFTDSRLPLQIRATWTPWECASLEARVGVDVYRELFFSDRHGVSVGSQPLDPALHFGLRWQMRF